MATGTRDVRTHTHTTLVKLVEFIELLAPNSCRHIDTAHVYGNEADVGRAVRDSGIPREEIFITSKLWPGSGGGGYEATKAAFQKAFDEMSIGYIDLYLIHAPTSKVRVLLYAHMRTVPWGA